jgi:ubiquinone/menaquinone biosynthesis C-methylase UbiE/DNA-binding HxlR family transcriptional regulator
MQVDPLPIFKALADESRLRIVNVLSQGPFNVQELTSVLALSQPTISHHLKILQQASLVSLSKQGTWAYYSLPNSEHSPISKQIVDSFLSSLTINGNAQLTPYSSDNTRINDVIDRRRDSSKRFFESVAPQWNQMRAEEMADSGPLHELVSRIPTEADIVDLGCGSGALLELILPRTGETIAVDYSQSMLNEASRTLGERKSGVDLRIGYLEHLPLADESVDVAVAHMVLHHLAEPFRALKDIRRILRPDGRCLIVDLKEHNREYMRERYADLWLGFNVDEISRWAKEAGFLQNEFEYFGANKEVFLLTLS